VNSRRYSRTVGDDAGGSSCDEWALIGGGARAACGAVVVWRRRGPRLRFAKWDDPHARRLAQSNHGRATRGTWTQVSKHVSPSPVAAAGRCASSTSSLVSGSCTLVKALRLAVGERSLSSSGAYANPGKYPAGAHQVAQDQTQKSYHARCLTRIRVLWAQVRLTSNGPPGPAITMNTPGLEAIVNEPSATGSNGCWSASSLIVDSGRGSS